MTDQQRYNLRVQRGLESLDADCAILSLTYKFDGKLCKVFDQGVLTSEWTVDQLATREVYP